MNLDEFSAIVTKYASIQPRFAPQFESPPVLEFWFREFGHLDSASFNDTMDCCVRTMDRFPSVRDVTEYLGKEPDEFQAREAASLISYAVSRFGSTRDLDRVRNHVGELAWWVIERAGGWYSICEKHRPDNAMQLEAQWRELAKCQLNRSRLGLTDDPPGLPEPRDRAGGLMPISGRRLIASLRQTGKK